MTILRNIHLPENVSVGLQEICDVDNSASERKVEERSRVEWERAVELGAIDQCSAVVNLELAPL